ncbi:hypothetical protein [Microcoleus vaginatus]|uniref:hypothetical protein n=1 Tax=Microcoleus vaginatus TaxID=119532 RepID=UPI001F623062
MASDTILTRRPKTSINLSCCSDRSLFNNAIALFPSASLCGEKKSDPLLQASPTPGLPSRDNFHDLIKFICHFLSDGKHQKLYELCSSLRISKTVRQAISM